MNTPMRHDDDQQWLDALAGKAPEGMDPVLRAQAAAVRQALATRRDAIEAEAHQPQAQALQRLQSRLSSEGLLQKADDAPAPPSWLGKVLGLLGGGGGSGGSARAISAWGVAAVLVLGVVVAYQVRGPQRQDVDVYRGNPNVTVLMVANPAARAEQLRMQIGAVKGQVEVKPLSNAQIQLKVKDSQEVRDYLMTQRIEAMPIDGYVVIVLQVEKKRQ